VTRDRVLTVAVATAILGLLIVAADANGHTGRASAYGPGLYGNPMACGGTLHPGTQAVAHRWLPCGTRLRVCYDRRCTDARVRDRGPYVGGRTLDLSEAVVRRLGYRSAMSWGVRVVVWRTR
jgi:rare lipoprotein A (peptidoglycan hydrolase)